MKENHAVDAPDYANSIAHRVAKLFNAYSINSHETDPRRSAINGTAAAALPR
jgi:hypothetical protein